MLDGLVDRLLDSDLKVLNYFLSINMEIKTTYSSMRLCGTPCLERCYVFQATDHFSPRSLATYVTQSE